MTSQFSLPFTAIKLIDRQHAQYVELVNDLSDWFYSADFDTNSLGAQTEAVVAYALEHFDAEEFLMRSHNYPDYEEHEAKHQKFREWIDGYQEKTASSNVTVEEAQRLLHWLTKWFAEQVKVDDQKLADFLSR
ncbi:MAG: hemerythrin family protein [Lentisphaerae bacterium]|jgi:hemerythrin|nr:hemerythrin family protein [Lentisphaerota bacterium]MBT4817168.1 hemerythrin family protein [Lentisphaerota bacterium]MBT5612190.1 hemerythrin family protein [Lentisphaerota bacterium]MBT7061117.1 hemerythrin family protein [Lentisphaerota bacterium]MBT7843446.1 hemerythrin family protein [Lentisphaerota bacterium]